MIALRDTGENDLDFVMTAENHPDNREYVNQWSLEEHLSVVKSEKDRHLLIIDRINQDRVGFLILRGFSQGIVELTRIVVTKKGMGFGRQALQLVKKMIFEEMDGIRLWLDVVDGNSRARSLYESEGFVLEGTLRKADYYQGKYQDIHLYSIIRDDIRTNHNR